MMPPTTKDIPVRISSANTASERRLNPAWTLAQLKGRLEPITGVPVTSQKLVLKDPTHIDIVLEAPDEDAVQLTYWALKPYSDIYVDDTRPAAARNLNLNDLSSVEKYSMPEETYAKLSDSVLAWKKANKLGRFDPNAPEVERQKVATHWKEAEVKGIVVGKRCRLGVESARRGAVSFVGEVPEIPGFGGPWIGITLDEPTGRNDGSVGGKRYFTCPDKRGVFVRPDRVEVGDYPEVMDGEDDDDMEEI